MPSPIARSAISPPGPCTVVDGWSLGTGRTRARLRLADHSHLAKIHIRADLDGRYAAALGVGFRRSRRRPDGTLLVGSGPGEWLLIGTTGSEGALVQEVRAAAGAEFVTAVIVTHGRAMLRLTGADAARTLAKLCAIDLSDAVTPDGAAFRSSVAKIATDVVHDDAGGEEPSYLLHCERSSGQYLFDCVLDAGAEYGIAPDGAGGQDGADAGRAGPP